jgi:regulator of nonsense transcripts 2
MLKLSKYVAEAASVIVENRLKAANDICSVVEVVSLFHQRYSDFRPSFLQCLGKELSMAKVGGEEYSAWLTRQRQLLRLLAELYLAGVVEDLSMVYRALTRLLPEDDTDGPLHVPIVTSFMKGVGPYFTGLNVVDEAIESFLIPEWRSKFNDAITAFFRAMCRLLVRTSNKLRSLEAKGRHYYETRGDLSTIQATQLQETLEAFEKQRANLQGLAEVLNLGLPDLGVDVETPKVVEGKVIFADLSIKSRRAEMESAIFNDEEERSFYEDLIDIWERVPEILLPQSGVTLPSSASETGTPNSLTDSPLLQTTPLEDLSEVTDVDPESVTKVVTDEQLSPEDRKSAASIKTFFERLPIMQSRNLADQAAIDFCYINSKAMRRRLIEVLIELPCRRFDLLPFIGRLLATLKPYFADVIAAVCSSLVGQYIFLFHKPNIPILGTRGRICRYIGELTKFGVMPQTTTFAMLKKAVLEDLSGYNIDMVAILLESCGRYLYNQPESHRRLLNLFEIIQKKKGQGMEPAQVVQLENAIYMVNPPTDRPVMEKKVKSPRMQYLFQLVRNDLTSGNSAYIFKQLRKFPWQDVECRRELSRALGKAWKVQYEIVPLLAAVASSFAAMYPSFMVDMVDMVLEEIQTGLEAYQTKYNQRLIASTRYVGELFWHSVIDASVVLGLLQQLMTFGHPGVPRVAQPSDIDPPESHFRIRLICILLHACTRHVTAASDNLDTEELCNSLDSLIVLFEYYVATKSKIPMDIEYLLEDTFDEMERQRHPVDLSDAIERLVAASNETLSFLRDDLNVIVLKEKEKEDQPDETEGFIISPPRDEQFEKALIGMIALSLEERKLERRAGVFDAPIPLRLSSPTLPDERTALKMLVKRRNKAITRELAVDAASVPFVGAALVGKERELREAREMGKLALESQRTPADDIASTGNRRKDSKVTFAVFGHRRTDS